MPRERFRVHEQAAAEVREAITWFAERDELLAKRFIAAVSKTFDDVLSAPGRFGNYLFRTRYARLAGFDYVVVYREVEHLIHIIAVAHTSRLPGYWKGRLRDIDDD